jgi:hypothetical protein
LVTVCGNKARSLFWFVYRSGLVHSNHYSQRVIAPTAARMYMEPYFWLLLVLVMQEKKLSSGSCKLFKWPVLVQSGFAIYACWICAVTLFPGVSLPSWRSAIMDRSENGYEVMQRAGQVLPENAVLLSEHRSMALAPCKSMSLEWINFVDIKAPKLSNI